MAKKIVVGLLVLAIAAGVLGAQEAPGRIAVNLDVFPLFKGIIWSDTDSDNSLFALAPAFEYLISPHFAVGGTIDLYFGEETNVSVFYFGLAVHGRWYPMSSGLDKLFIDTGLGFNVFSLDGKTAPDDGGFSGLTASLKAGYKLMFTPNFFIEPSIAFVYAKLASSFVPTPYGWQPGLSMGVSF
jgi:hypothetical protein